MYWIVVQIRQWRDDLCNENDARVACSRRAEEIKTFRCQGPGGGWYSGTNRCCVMNASSPWCHRTHTHIPSKQAAASVKDKRHVITKPQIAPLIKVLDNHHRADDLSSPCCLAPKLKSSLAPSPSPPSYSQLPSDCQCLELSWHICDCSPTHACHYTREESDVGGMLMMVRGGSGWSAAGKGREHAQVVSCFLFVYFFIKSRICESVIRWLCYKTCNTVYPAREHSVCEG